MGKFDKFNKSSEEKLLCVSCSFIFEYSAKTTPISLEEEALPEAQGTSGQLRETASTAQEGVEGSPTGGAEETPFG